MTYSLSVTGQGAGYLSSTKTLTLSDSSATAGAQLNSMQLNTPFLAKGPDGSQAWYTLDAERSTPSNPILKAVGP